MASPFVSSPIWLREIFEASKKIFCDRNRWTSLWPKLSCSCVRSKHAITGVLACNQNAPVGWWRPGKSEPGAIVITRGETTPKCAPNGWQLRWQLRNGGNNNSLHSAPLVPGPQKKNISGDCRGFEGTSGDLRGFEAVGGCRWCCAVGCRWRSTRTPGWAKSWVGGWVGRKHDGETGSGEGNVLPFLVLIFSRPVHLPEHFVHKSRGFHTWWYENELVTTSVRMIWSVQYAWQIFVGKEWKPFCYLTGLKLSQNWVGSLYHTIRKIKNHRCDFRSAEVERRIENPTR